MESAEETRAREFEPWRAVAPGWRKHDRRLTVAFGAVSERLLERAGIVEGHHVLDVACGKRLADRRGDHNFFTRPAANRLH